MAFNEYHVIKADFPKLSAQELILKVRSTPSNKMA